MTWFGNVRLALLITLSILLLAVLYRRFKLNALTKHMPTPQHAELLALSVSYHPTRLRVEIAVPAEQSILPVLLKADHTPLHTWTPILLSTGAHTVELDLAPDWEGEHYFQLGTDTQRTVRKFRIIRA
jgi:hypothetical protein